jgi:hypothetical protein
MAERNRSSLSWMHCHALCAAAIVLGAANVPAALPDSLKAITAIQREGEGNEGASAAWRETVNAGPNALLSIFGAMGRGTVVADNWLRLAGDTIVQNALTAGKPLPIPEMEAFLRDSSNPGPGRRLAFDLIRQADSARADALEASLLNDPVQELRRGAVQRLIDQAKAKGGDEAKAGYLEALDAVRDEDQTRFLAGELKKMGVPVDLPRHFGFLMKWHVIGPFDNAERKGFDTVFPPEREVKLEGTCEGKESKPLAWQPFESAHELGKIDLNKPLGMHKEATGYAVTTFDSPTERDAELRLGSKNAWKVWLNGEFQFGRDEYHRGQQMDQYVMKVRLKKGANTVLVKCCQNEQKEEWTVEWDFQLRVCDGAGTALSNGAVAAN